MSDNKKLELKIQPRVIDHLGIKMYQKPIDVVSELIANSWDADAKEVDIVIGKDADDQQFIEVTDNGMGMTFDECQNFFLSVGRDRRKELNTDKSISGTRPVLGRKGIGKFAGFGIANKIMIETTSANNGEHTIFVMDLSKIMASDHENDDTKEIEVIKHEPANDSCKKNSGTKISLFEMNKEFRFIESNFINGISKRFLLTQISDDFKILINKYQMPNNFIEEMEFVFPRDYSPEDIKNLKFENEWAMEEIVPGKTVKWRIGFLEDTIKEEELRGITIFTKGKMSQKPFLFELTGGISAQNALEYMTGQVQIDFIDEGEVDLIATERQRINLESEEGQLIKNWGQELIKKLTSIWKERRSEKRTAELESKVEGFKDRLDRLPRHEKDTVKSALLKIARISSINKSQFQELAKAVLTSWESGRVRDLISDISKSSDLDETAFLTILSESDVITALNIAEAVKTKIIAISELKNRVKSKELENKVRDFIYENPWIISPKWEKFQKEKSVENIIKMCTKKHFDSYEFFNGRVDLVLSCGSGLLIVEFMRPGLKLDVDHIDRTNYYVMEVKNALKKESASRFKHVEAAFLIADSVNDSELMQNRIEQIKNEGIFTLSWNTLIEESIKQWEDFLKILKLRHPTDPRLQEL